MAPGLPDAKRLTNTLDEYELYSAAAIQFHNNQIEENHDEI
jgi:hypothetical protein